MKIRRLRFAVIEANYDWTMVRIETDTGPCGLGECFFAPGLTGMLRDLEPLLLGQDPRNIQPLFKSLQRAASGAGSVSGIIYNAISGIEAALWDLAGRALGAPIWQLLGGRFRSTVQVYADCHAGTGLESYGPALLPRNPGWFPASGAADTPDALAPEAWARRARAAVAAGFSTLKFDLDAAESPTVETVRLLRPTEIAEMVSRVAAVREAVGPGVDLAIDCHWRYRLADVVRIARALEPFDLLWLEDPLPPFNPDSFRALRQATSVPICTGENLFLVHGFRELLAGRAVQIISPDLQKVGGLGEGRRLAELAEMHDVVVAPHCIAGPVGTMASVHLCAAIPNFLSLEFHGQDVPFWDLVAQGFERPMIRAGVIQVPDAPGLGIELNEEMVREHLKPGEGFFD